MEIIRYNHLNSYLKSIFGERTLKICIDGKFTCPNRDGKCGFGGCIFCGERGAGDNMFAASRVEDESHLIEYIKNQVQYFLNSYKGDRANKFIVYFQNYTNTYDTIENLKVRYDAALNVRDKIIGICVGTRPDCVNEEVVELLKSYTHKYYVCVELGLQTANDEIGKIINRGYSVKDFVSAVNLLKENGISVVAHMMIGLPEEKEKDIYNTVQLINDCKCDGIKIHSTFINENTELNNMYKSGDYQPITLEYYVDKVCKIISNLNKDMIIHRITGDPNLNVLVEPKWTGRKKIVLNSINNKLNDLDIVQGDKKLKFIL